MSRSLTVRIDRRPQSEYRHDTHARSGRPLRENPGGLLGFYLNRQVAPLRRRIPLKTKRQAPFDPAQDFDPIKIDLRLDLRSDTLANVTAKQCGRCRMHTLFLRKRHAQIRLWLVPNNRHVGWTERQLLGHSKY